MKADRLDGCHSCRWAALSIILGCDFWLLGNFNCSALAAVSITGVQAVANLSVIRGSPEQFAADMKESTSFKSVTSYLIFLRKAISTFCYHGFGHKVDL
jgi:hypothetical protein